MGRSAGTARDGVLHDDGSAARDAALTAAILRTGVSVDLDTVLREVVDSARALTDPSSHLASRA